LSSHRNSSPAPTPTNEFASAKEFVDQLQSQLVKKFDELARMAINFRGWISNYLPQVAQPIAGTDPTAAMYAAVLKLAARWALVEDKNEQQKAGSAAGSAPPPQSGPPQQQGWMVFMPQQPQQGGAPPQQQHG
jgi:hypothetical protein